MVWPDSKQPSRNHAFLKAIPIIAGVATAGVGFAALLGWITGTPILVMMVAGRLPVPLNSAIALLALGTGLTASAFEMRKTAMAGSSLALLIAGITFLQRITGIDVGADDALSRVAALRGPEFAFRMPTNVAAFFILMGVTIMAVSRRSPSPLIVKVCSLVGLFVAAFGFSALFGFLTDIHPRHDIFYFSRMTAGAAVGFVALGVGLAVRAFDRWRSFFASSSRFLIFAAGMAALTVSFNVSQLIIRVDEIKVESKTHARLESLTQQLRSELGKRVDILEGLAVDALAKEKWRDLHWDLETKRFMAKTPDLLLIIKGSELSGDRVATGKLAVSPMQEIIEQVRRSSGPVVSDVIDLPNDESIILVAVPIGAKGGVIDTIIGVVDFQRFQSQFAEISDASGDYHHRVLPQSIWKRISEEQTWTKWAAFDFLGSRWIVEVTPSDSLIQRESSLLPGLVQVIGLIMALLLASSVYFALKAQAWAIETEAARGELEKLAVFQNAILDSADLSIVSTDVNGVITSFNSGAERLLGYTANEMVGRMTPAAFHDPQEVAARAEGLSEESSARVEPGFAVFSLRPLNGAKDEGEWTYVGKDGRRVPVHLTVTAIRNRDGNIEGFLGIAADITKEKQAQRIIERQRAKILSSAKMSALGEMAGGIAHEINNPLAIINGKSEQLARLLEAGTIDLGALTEGLRKIAATSIRIAKIVNGLRVFARDGGSDPFLPVKLGPVVEDAASLCRERFRVNNVELDITIDCPDAVFECRAVQVSQVLLNLMNNAFNAASRTPEKWVKLRCEDHGDQVRIMVTDSGLGISPEVQEKMFQPFFTTEEVGRGTGLGLSISRGIVEDHHGSISYDPSSEQTRFVVSFPKQQQAVKRAV